MLEEIMAWLTGAEATLTAAEALPDPKEIPSIKTLLDDHRSGFVMALTPLDSHFLGMFFMKPSLSPLF